MKKKSVWVGVSTAMFSLLASGNPTFPGVDQENERIQNSTNQIWFNEDGSAIIANQNEKVIHLSAEMLQILRKVKPGQGAYYRGNAPCVGHKIDSKTLLKKERR